jgi:hypothetical protein
LGVRILEIEKGGCGKWEQGWGTVGGADGRVKSDGKRYTALDAQV